MRRPVGVVRVWNQAKTRQKGNVIRVFKWKRRHVDELSCRRWRQNKGSLCCSMQGPAGCEARVSQWNTKYRGGLDSRTSRGLASSLSEIKTPKLDWATLFHLPATRPWKSCIISGRSYFLTHKDLIFTSAGDRRLEEKPEAQFLVHYMHSKKSINNENDGKYFFITYYMPDTILSTLCAILFWFHSIHVNRGFYFHFKGDKTEA